MHAYITQEGEIIRLEFEASSRSFIAHGHLQNIQKDETVLIICWEDNWENRQSNIDVIELRHFSKSKAQTYLSSGLFIGALNLSHIELSGSTWSFL